MGAIAYMGAIAQMGEPHTGKEVGRFVPSPPFNNCTQRYHYCISFPPYRTLRPTSTMPSPSKTHLAVKIYKTFILIFKNRDRYATGGHRFRRGYSKNPRKMVHTVVRAGTHS